MNNRNMNQRLNERTLKTPGFIISEAHRRITAGLLIRAGFNDAQLERALKRDSVSRDNWEEVAEEGYHRRRRSLVDVCRDAVKLDGGRPSHDTDDTIRSAVSGGSLSAVFEDATNKVLLNAFDEEPDSTVGWVGERDIKDFKQGKLIDFSANADLEPLPRGASARHASVSDGFEPMQLARFAKQFAADEQDIIDDDLGVLTGMPTEFGKKARQLRGDLAYLKLLTNPTMNQDQKALFHVDHNNLLTGGDTVLASASVKVAIQTMGNQTAPDGSAANVRASFLLVPPQLRFAAMEIVNSTTIMIAGTAGSVTERGTMNVLAGENIQIRSDARLGTVGLINPFTRKRVTGTATNWFMAAQAGRTIDLIFRVGTSRLPTIRTSPLTQGRWGTHFDVCYDIGVAVGDYRGLSKSEGA
jgi:hypothetical protein